MWNHRVMRTRHKNGEVTYSIHEVYYDEAGEVDGYSGPMHPCGYGDDIGQDGPTDEDSRGLASLRWVLEHMLAALDKPILDYEGDPE